MTDHTQLRKVAEAATPGPWHRTSTNDAHWLREVRSSQGGVAWCGHRQEQAHKDSEFIAAANPQAVIELLDEIDRLTVALKKANEQTEHFEREWYLRGDEIERLKDLFRVNMLCAFPKKSHDEITAEIEKALK